VVSAISMMFAIASYAQLFHALDVHPGSYFENIYPGSYFENMYALMCLGISQDSIPKKKWLKALSIMDELDTHSGIVVCGTPFDLALCQESLLQTRVGLQMAGLRRSWQCKHITT
jgi:hypothetical protein